MARVDSVVILQDSDVELVATSDISGVIMFEVRVLGFMPYRFETRGDAELFWDSLFTGLKDVG